MLFILCTPILLIILYFSISYLQSQSLVLVSLLIDPNQYNFLIWTKILKILLHFYPTRHHHHQWILCKIMKPLPLKILKILLHFSPTCHHHHQWILCKITKPFHWKLNSSQTFPSMLQTQFLHVCKPLNSSSGPQTPSNDDNETQFPQFYTQIGLENITLEWGEYSTKKSHKFSFLLKRIHILLVRDLMFQWIQLLVMVKQEIIFGWE